MDFYGKGKKGTKPSEGFSQKVVSCVLPTGRRRHISV